MNCKFLFQCEDFSEEQVYTCFIENANLITKDQVIKEIKGNHLEGKSHRDVKWIQFCESSTVKHFPRGLQNHFPNLTHLTISVLTGSGIKEISKNDFIGLERLVYLSIEGC